MDSTLISCQDLSLVYRVQGSEFIALDKVTLSIAPGEFVALVGESGAGKTSLLNVLGTLDRPNSGKLHIFGYDVLQCEDSTLARLRNERIGFVFQHFHLHPKRTALQNIILPFYFSEHPLQEAIAKGRKLLARLGLSGLENRLINRLSGGQRQRIALARALILEPDLILADEPIGHLDKQSAQLVADLLTEVNQHGTTCIVATHDNLLLERATKIYSLQKGQLTLLTDPKPDKYARTS